MIRLAVAGVDDATLRDLGRRLQPVRLVPCPSQEADAAAILGPLDTLQGDVREAIDTHRASRRPLLVCGDVVPADVRIDSSANAIRIRNRDRFLPSRQLIRQQLDSGKLGAPALVRSHRWGPSPSVGSHGNRLPSGLLTDIDIAQWLMGSPVELVYAAQSSAGEAVQVHLGFAAGGMALLDWGRIPEGDSYRSLSLLGSSGAAYADDHANRQLMFASGHARTLVADETLRGLANLLSDFVKELATPASADQATAGWHDAVRVGNVAWKSLQTGRAIRREDF
jgi:hypothetical protein